MAITIPVIDGNIAWRLRNKLSVDAVTSLSSKAEETTATITHSLDNLVLIGSTHIVRSYYPILIDLSMIFTEIFFKSEFLIIKSAIGNSICDRIIEFKDLALKSSPILLVIN